MKAQFEKLYQGQNLSRADAKALFDEIFRGGLSDVQLASLLTALKMKGETPDEIGGAASAMVNAARVFPKHGAFEIGEIVGTGGDGQATINVSTTAALAAAGSGLFICKHGNRAISSKSGASDLLSALGFDIEAAPEESLRLLEETGFAFCYAPLYHPAMRRAAPVRTGLGTRTIFNLLGPLTNPARPTYAVIGVYDPNLLDTIAAALKGLGVKRAFVLHGSGLDEAAVAGGLNDRNVGELARRLPAPMEVDVNSGVESAPGIKSRTKHLAFFEALRRGERAPSPTQTPPIQPQSNA